MVGLADIPVVGKFVERASEKTVEAVFRGLRYMFCYKALVDQLNSEIEKLNIEEDEMSGKVQKEKKNGKKIKDYVSKWQGDAEKIQKSAEELSPSCSCIQRLPIPNPISRFRIGRKAAKKAKAVTELINFRKEHLNGAIAYLPEAISMPTSDTAFEEFPSRKDAYQKLWDALVNEDGPVIHGIYGMAGVGKTRMMEQLRKEAVEKKIFKKAVRVNVGNEDMEGTELQKKIAGHVECNLKSEVMEIRASLLKNNLRNGNKVLLILDDVWRDIELETIIGTPFDDGCSSSKGSKILFTSRMEKVCLVNKCQQLVELKTLSPDEAWCMFKKTVAPADSDNPLPNESLMKEVCDKCGELPLLIHAVGKALKGKPRYWWTNAHDQLKKGKLEEIPDVDRQVYSGVKLSIDYLKYDDAKSCLLLCSMFPEDADIDIKTLIQLATGSQLIPDGESRVLTLVDHLKESSLLLNSGDNAETKVHDIIRDVARSIAFTDSKYAFLKVTCDSRYLPLNANYSTRRFLRLDVETEYVDFGEHWVCPDLHTLWLKSTYRPWWGQPNHPQQFSGGFYSMFVNVSCLMLQNVDISSEHFSLQPLGKIGTLSLLECDISNTDATLFPKRLESLCIYECQLPEPLDIANLERLRKLEIRGRIAVLVRENVISTLSSLEELHVSHGFVHSRDEYHMEPIVKEMSKLTRLTSLHFEFYGNDTFRGTNISLNLNRYNIFVDEGPETYSSSDQDWEVPLTKSIRLSGNHWKPWEGLMVSAEQVNLWRSNVDVSSICNEHTRAFQDLNILNIYNCHNMGHLASISQDRIQQSVQSATCFSKLTILNIRECSKLKYLFCNCIAKSLVELQELSVDRCSSMEAIVMNQGTSDGEVINFSKLKSLQIEDTPKLRSFYSQNSDYPSAPYPALLDKMVAFPSLEYISIYKCGSLRNMFASSVARDLKQLKEMIVRECEEMRSITRVDELAISDEELFPELTILVLYNLPNLMSFWSDQNGKADTCKAPLIPPLSSNVVIDFPHLQSFFDDQNFKLYMPVLKMVTIRNCQITTLFTFSVFKKFQLTRLHVSTCDSLVNIVGDLKGDQICDQIITLSTLEIVNLVSLPNLKRFFHIANCEFHMPVVKRVKIVKCGLSNTLFTRSIFKNLQQLEKLRVSDCKLLDGIFEDAIGDKIVDTSEKIITLNQVYKICLTGLPKLKSIFHGATYEWCMPALKNVTIAGCEQHFLFTCSVFQGIRQLETLNVYECESLEHIVKEVGGDETFGSGINGKNITHSQLSSIALKSLPNLKSFSCSRSYIFSMPELKYFTLRQCPKIEYFSSSDTRGPPVHVNRRILSYEEEAFTDVNDYVRQITEGKAT